MGLAVEDWAFRVRGDADQLRRGLKLHALASEGGELAPRLGNGHDGGTLGHAHDGTGLAVHLDHVTGSESERVSVHGRSESGVCVAGDGEAVKDSATVELVKARRGLLCCSALAVKLGGIVGGLRWDGLASEVESVRREAELVLRDG
jgi:hypothetical protein